MNSREIRKVFLEFFVSKGHELIKSSSLIPKGDPTLLFTNAGMVQFKSVFLGEETRPYKRATSCQKCLRAGGKHSDIENVGHTARHHTFFEMLGNFSFGDYFKREAISFAWELLTGWFKLPEKRLWVSIYEGDDEAASLWKDVTGIPENRIVRLGAKENFWQMGDTGPCGPCSEIIIDQGPDVGCGKEGCSVGCECDRYLEIWNLVFMQYNRNEKGELSPLPRPSIDTGMGLERITAVLQGKLNNFDTDIFSEIISSISDRAGISYGKSPETDISIRVIADHIRAIGFLLSEGLIPSNEGRGYVLRRIIRRAARHARMLGLSGPVLFRFLDSLAGSMGDIYPELIDEKERASRILEMEEERFAKTLDQGMRLIEDLIKEVKRSGRRIIPGEEIFKLYDTYGFPYDLARDIAIDYGLTIDETGFHREMELQRERARASWVGEEEAVAPIYRELINEIGRTEFVGYETLESDSIIKAIVLDGKVVKEAREGEEVEVFLDITPFYGESGGQVGDEGEIFGEFFRAAVMDTSKPIEGFHSHHVRIKKGILRVWDRVHCKVNEEKRRSTMRNHTATHLLQAALKIVLGDHVKQAGSLVSPEKLRFDFTHFSPLSKEEIMAIEDIVNEKILEDLPVKATIMDLKAAIASGATALFGDKYGERVRVITVPDYSSELCGGTHCRATGEIGLFIITSEESIASGIRRIEALTGKNAFNYLKSKAAELSRIEGLLKTDQPYQRVQKLLNELKGFEKEVEKLKVRTLAKDFSSIIEEARVIDGIKVISCRIDGLDAKDLRTLADNIRDKVRSGIIFIASAKNGQASFISMVTKDLIDRFDAAALMKRVSSIAGGKGGGKREMAQGGTSHIERLDRAIKSVYDLIKEKGE